MSSIEIIVSSDGRARVETRGFSGATCQEASRFLERALGRTTSEQLTAEYHQTLQPQSLDQHQTTSGPGEP